MTTWPHASIGSLVKVIGGGTPTRTNPDYYGGDIPWVTPKDMKTWDIHSAQVTLTKLGLDKSSAKLAPSNSVLIVVRSGVLKHTVPVGISRVPVAINQDMKALICSENILPAYLARFIKQRSTEILKWVRATTADNFPVEKLKNLKVPLPPLDEQQRVVELLDQADGLQAKRRQAIALLDTLAQSIFLDMFGDPASNPKGWKISFLGDLGQVQGGLQVTSKRKSLPVEVPYLRVANVYRNRLDLREIKSIRATENELKRTCLKSGDLLVVEGHGNASEIGRVAVWDGSIDRCTHQNHLIRVRLTPRILPAYACALLNSPGGRRHLLREANTTSGLNTISTSDVRSTPMMVPPLGLQEQYVERLSGIERLRSTHQAHLAELSGLFGSLQQRAFRGEL